MFAVAAFALGGMAFAPAYAADYASFKKTIVSGVNIDSDSTSCGSSDTCSVSMWAVSGTDDVNLTFSVDGNTNCDRIDLYIVGNTGPAWNEYKLGGFNMGPGSWGTTITGPGNLVVGEKLTVSAHFIGCS